MSTHRYESALAYANVAVHREVPIEMALAAHGVAAVEINIGLGPELEVDFADVESLERLRDVAADAARQLRERIEENQPG